MKYYSKKDVGNFGEDICAKYIKKKGYKILERNSRLGKLETDIIASNKTHIIFIEVKTRRIDKNNYTRPSNAVNSEKISNLLKFAYYYIKTLPKKHISKQPRIDVCEVLIKEENEILTVHNINYIENALSR